MGQSFKEELAHAPGLFQAIRIGALASFLIYTFIFELLLLLLVFSTKNFKVAFWTASQLLPTKPFSPSFSSYPPASSLLMFSY